MAPNPQLKPFLNPLELVPSSALIIFAYYLKVQKMHLSSVYVLLLSCIVLLSPLSAFPDSGISPFTPVDGFQPPDSPDIGENFAEPPPPLYQGDILGSPPAGTPDNGNTDLLPSPPDDVLPRSPQLPDVPPPSTPIADATHPPKEPFVPPPTGDAPLPTPQLPVILPPPSDSSLPISPQLPFASPPSDNSLPLSPQLPFASPASDNLLPLSPQLPFASPPSDNLLPESPQLPLASSPLLPGSPHSPLAYHHPKDTQPETSMAPAPFGVYPNGQNQGQQFGQANSGLFGQQQSANDVPLGEQYGGCSSTRVDLIGTAMALIGLLLISWV